MRYRTTLDSPMGRLALISDGTALTAIMFCESRDADRLEGPLVESDAVAPFPQARRELAEYFAGKRTTFAAPLAPCGTAFQLRVWAALQRIPYGATATYADIAREVGSPKAVRAVGAANGCNPIAFVVPSHRVIGSDGTLTGYGGGLPRKKALLDLESSHAPASEKAGKLF